MQVRIWLADVNAGVDEGVVEEEPPTEIGPQRSELAVLGSPPLGSQDSRAFSSASSEFVNARPK